MFAFFIFNMKIKNIILDLGGVLLNIDYLCTIDAFKKLGISNFEQMYTQAQQNKLFDAFETGHITAEEFLSQVALHLPKETKKDEIISAWNAMLFDLPKERLEFLKQLKKQYNLVLLSNTNTIHLEHFHQILKAEHGIDNLLSYFKTTYFSCEMGMRKPHPEIFLKVCELEGFDPKDTLFIDDTQQHVEGAIKAGLHAHYLDVEKTNVMELLSSLLA